MTSLWEDIKSYALWFFGALAAIFAFLFFLETKKKDAAEALNQNQEVKTKVEQINTQIAATDGQLKSEEQKRQDAVDATKKEEGNDSKDDLLKFLDSDSKPK